MIKKEENVLEEVCEGEIDRIIEQEKYETFMRHIEINNKMFFIISVISIMLMYLSMVV